MKIDNRTVLLTGGSSGLGLALAGALVARGNTVVAVGRDPGRLQAARAAVPGLHAIACDVADPDALPRLHEMVQKDFPALDMLVNNAGVMREIDFNRATDVDRVADEVDVNFGAVVRLCAWFVPMLMRRPGSCIVNVSSGLAFAPFPAAPVYSATKAALHSFTQSLRIQLKSSGVRVVELAPPAIDTPMLTGAMRAAMDGQRMASAADIAAIALRDLEAGVDEITPGGARMLRLLSRLAPSLLMRQMAAMYASHAASSRA
ncbi:MAG: SDR family NAD(P)-dependent oxidoreductase [Xanthomonadaceae bacterium]|nr:SDR family NAD(P)-dependent oxidoreductase [Xanthomonadaceae bacterium]MDE1962760.1 SDR family NAD(P)-dependent oxidoreductase [Xanthomonadaceae bacterium]